MKSIIVLIKSIFFILLFFSCNALSKTLNKIEIIGNDRISDEVIKLFTKTKINEEINNNKLNIILKNLYETDFFTDVTINYVDKTLIIKVIENPIVEKISYKGIKNKKTLEIKRSIMYILVGVVLKSDK